MQRIGANELDRTDFLGCIDRKLINIYLNHC
jgi:hypothetical protein